MSNPPPSIEDLDKRVQYLEIIEGIRQECPPGQVWSGDANKCVDLAPVPPAADDTSEPVPIVTAQSSGADGANVPANAYDGNPATRFSVKGLGSWISLDLGAVQEVRQIQFMWYTQPGEQRTNVVTLEFSDQPNATPAASSPSTTEHTNHGDPVSQAGPFDPVKQARSIVVKLVSTTNPGQWFSITDIKVTGKVLTPVVITPEPPEPTPVPPAPVTGESVDAFGTQKIYGDGVGGSNWAMDMNDPGGDPRGKNPESSSYMPKFTKNSDGSWKIKGQIEIRWAITQDNGFHQDKVCTDFQKCTEQGFMQDSGDWGTPPNGVEQTAYYKINKCGSSSRNGEAHFEHVMKGWRSTTGDQKVGPCNCPIGCSFNYHGNTYTNKCSNGKARQKWECDLKHTSGYKKDISGVNNNTAYNFTIGKWFGIKTIVYELPDHTIQLEHWTDEHADNSWKKTHSFIDNGKDWQPRDNANGCNVPKVGNQIRFGGPLCVFRSDNLQDYDIKNASLRSIDASVKLLGADAHAADASTDHPPTEGDVVLQNQDGTLSPT